MPDWWWSPWILEWLGFVLIGGGLVAGALAYAQHARRGRETAALGVPGSPPAFPGINMARIRVGGDVGGLVVVIGIVLAFVPMMWGWFLAVGGGAVLLAVGLFLWHRHYPR